MSFKYPTDQMAHWLEVLSQYDFRIEHRAGKKHGNVDSLSRISCDPTECDCCDRNTILEELPCGGCKVCRKRHEQWSVLAEVDDVVPLFTRNISSRASKETKHQKTSVTSLFFMLILTVSDMIANVVKVVKECLNFQSCWGNTSWSLRRLRPALEDSFNLQDSPVEQLNTDKELLHSSVEVVSQGDKPLVEDTLSQSAGLCKDLKRSPLASYQPEQICIMQKNDPEIGRLIEWKSVSTVRPNRDLVAGESPYVRHLWLLWDQLCLKDGVLFKQWIAHSGTQVYLQLVLPSILKKQVLESSHSALSSAHLGVNKTVNKIKQNFYWYRLKESVRDYMCQMWS